MEVYVATVRGGGWGVVECKAFKSKSRALYFLEDQAGIREIERAPRFNKKEVRDYLEKWSENQNPVTWLEWGGGKYQYILRELEVIEDDQE